MRFALRLALALGKSLAELGSMTAAELSLWMAYDAMEPIGAWREDYNAAQIACMIGNAHRDKDTQPFAPQDFMPFTLTPDERQRKEDVRRKAQATIDAAYMRRMAHRRAVADQRNREREARRLGNDDRPPGSSSNG